MIYITAIRMSNGAEHEHVIRVQWTNPSNGRSGESSTVEIVDWIRLENGDARISGRGVETRVGIVDTTPPHLRSYADGIWTNNLLALPRF